MAALALAVHGLWIGALFARGYEARDFIGLGRAYVARGDQAGPIHVDPAYRYVPNGIGYDGQWAYYIALDPAGAALHVDGPSYRYGRILYPVLARLVAVGRAELVPYALLAVNLLAVAGGTFALAAWLLKRGQPAWIALLYAFNPGMVIALHRDLTEPLAYGLVAAAVLAFDSRVRGRHLLAALLFALALLARETTAVFAVVYGGALLLRDRPRGLALLAIALAPFLAWEAFLRQWLGPLDPGQAGQFELLPLGGLAHAGPYHLAQLRVLVAVILPAALVGGAVAWALWRGAREVAPVALVANLLLFVVFLPRQSYIDPIAAPRVALGVVLAAALSLPAIASVLRDRRWFWAAAALWVVLVPVTLALNLLDRPSGLVRV